MLGVDPKRVIPAPARPMTPGKPVSSHGATPHGTDSVTGKDAPARTVLVTGGAGGLGRGLCEAFAADGWRVVVHHKPGELSAAEFIETLRTKHTRVTSVAADLAEDHAAEQVFSQLDASVGMPHAVVNNAAWDPGHRPLDEIDPGFLHQLLGINLKSPLLMIQQATKRWLAAGHTGSVINISSVHSRFSTPGRSAYAASKGALEAMTRQLAVELGPAGIRVNAVAPGFVLVPRTEAAKTGEELAAVTQRVPIRRLAEPSDIAQVVTYLASPASGFISGQVITVDGASTCCLPTQQTALSVSTEAESYA